MTNAGTSRDRGAIVPLTAMSLAVIILMVSFAVDLGRQRAERRDMQAVADVVSLDLARKLEGRSATVIDNDPAFSTAIEDSAARNDHVDPTVPCPTGDISGTCLTVVLGSWDADTDPDNPVFAPCKPIGDPDRSSCLPDAVEVTAGTNVDYRFQPGSGDTRRSAVARIGDLARGAFRVGSRLAAVNPTSDSIIGQILNSVAPGASVLSYAGLVDADVSLEELGVALGVPITAASPHELLDTQVTYEQLAVATARALENSGGEAADVAVLDDFASLEVSEAQVSLGEALGVSADGGSPAADATVNAAQFLTASAFLVDGEHFVTVPDAVLGIPGIGSATLTMTGIEAPITVGDHDGASGTTSQVRLELTTDLAIDSGTFTQQLCSYPTNEQNALNGLVGGVLNILGCALNPLSAPLDVSAQISGAPTLSLDLAEVTATQHLDCDNRTLGVTTSPSIVDLSGEFDLDVDVTVGDTNLSVATLDVPVIAQATGAPGSVAFVGVEPGTPSATGVVYEEFSPPSASTGTNPLGLSNFLQVYGSNLSVLGSNLDILTGVVEGVVQNLLNDVLHQIDVTLVQPLTELLGLNLGGSDLEPLRLECDQRSVLLVE